MAFNEESTDIKKALLDQLIRPVPWVGLIESISKQGVTRFIECGTGKVLSGLNKRILKTAKVMTIHNRESIENGLTE